MNKPSPRHLRTTPLLDWTSPDIARLVRERGWSRLDLSERIGSIYAFVRDEMAFGYNEHDALPASRVLADGYGQCNTKNTLLMALLRAVELPCRLRGFTIDKRLQKGVVTGFFYLLAPREILHTWVEVWFENRWVALEGVILDRRYLDGVRWEIAPAQGPFLGYGLGVEDIASPPIEWRGEDTFIQRTGIVRSLGLYEDPDALYTEHGENLSGPRAWLFARWVRHRMNARVEGLRKTEAPLPPAPSPSSWVGGARGGATS